MGSVFRLSRVLAIAFALLAGLVSETRAVECDAIVSDDAKVFGDPSAVEEAAKELMGVGADVHIVTVKSHNAANFDQYAEKLMRSCASWRGSDGDWKNNVIVLAISIDERDMGLYYGGEWEVPLKKSWLRIQQDHMKPALRRGEFDTAFIAALDEIKRLADEHLHPPVRAEAPVGTQPAPVVVEIQKEPVDMTGLWTVLYWAVMIALFALMMFGVTKVFSELEKRRVARSRALSAKNVCALYITRHPEEFEPVKARLNLLARTVCEDDAKPLQERLQEIDQSFGSAAAEFAGFDNSAHDPARRRLTASEYGAMEEDYDRVTLALGEAKIALGELAADIEKMNQLVEGMPGLLVKAESAIKRAQEAVELVQRDGYCVQEIASALTQAELDLKLAKASVAERRYRDTERAVGEIIALADAKAGEAAALPERRKTIEQQLAAATEHIENVKRLITAGCENFTEIEAAYADESWEAVAGNGTEATNRVNWAAAEATDARTAASMETQNWEEAEASLTEITGWLDQAESFMRSITALRDSLAKARADAPREMSEAEADIAKARAYIRDYDDDVRDELEGELRAAEESLNTARAEFGASRPNVLRVMELACGANSAADRILADAQGEHEAADRLRARAQSAKRDAEAAVSRAREFAEDHSRDVTTNSRGQLAEAGDLTDQAGRAAALQRQVELYEAAKSKAESAYKAIERNRRERRQAESAPTWGTVYTTPAYRSPSHHTTSRSHGGGGSSSWGLGGGHSGGGSSSFGFGGGHSGGGSSKW